MRRSTDRPWLTMLVTVGIVLLAGCLSGVGPSASPTRSPDDRASPMATVSSTESPQPAKQPCPEAISFWNLGGSGSNHAGWSANEVSVGFYSPADIDVFHPVLFVVYENDTLLGVKRWTGVTGSNAAHVDGFTITLDEHLEGTHTIRVVAHSDTNGNEEFDRGTDRPCYYKGTLNQAGPKTINFSSFSATETSS